MVDLLLANPEAPKCPLTRRPIEFSIPHPSARLLDAMGIPTDGVNQSFRNVMSDKIRTKTDEYRQLGYSVQQHQRLRTLCRQLVCENQVEDAVLGDTEHTQSENHQHHHQHTPRVDAREHGVGAPEWTLHVNQNLLQQLESEGITEDVLTLIFPTQARLQHKFSVLVIAMLVMAIHALQWDGVDPYPGLAPQGEYPLPLMYLHRTIVIGAYITSKHDVLVLAVLGTLLYAPWSIPMAWWIAESTMLGAQSLVPRTMNHFFVLGAIMNRIYELASREGDTWEAIITNGLDQGRHTLPAIIGVGAAFRLFGPVASSLFIGVHVLRLVTDLCLSFVVVSQQWDIIELSLNLVLVVKRTLDSIVPTR